MKMPKFQIPNSNKCPTDQLPMKGHWKLAIGNLFVVGNWSLVILTCVFLLGSVSFAADEKIGVMPAAKNIVIDLPSPKIKSAFSLEEAIYKRRSKRSFTQGDLTLEQIGQLLWAAQGITDQGMGFRAAPSPGALYPLEVYIAKKDGLFHYIPQGHKLNSVSGEDLRTWLSGMAGGQDFIREAPVDIIICAVYARVTPKYGERGAHFADMEAGHAGQNIQLQAVSLGLGSCVVGAFEPKEVAAALNLPKDEEPVYIIPVGYTK